MTAAASFNGGRSQTGLNFLQTGGEYPFLNVVKTCQDWAYVSAPNKDGIVDPSLFDENGYPTSIQTGGYYAVCYVPASWVGESLTVQWDGGGTVLVPGTLVSGSATSSSGTTDNSLTCTCLNQRIVVGASATNASPNHIKNLRVSLTGSETTLLNSGEVFSTAFKNKLIEGGFGVLRFMDWQVNNTTNMTTWASRKPLTYFSYQASEFRNVASTGRPKLYCGSTTNSGNAYSITGNGDGVPASGAPVDKQIIQFRYNADATQSGTCSLDLNGAGAKNILDWRGNALSAGGNSYPQSTYFSNPTYTTAIFDADLDAWLNFGGNQAVGTRGIIGGVPAELCVQLAAEVGAHPYFCMPRMAADPATDYMTSLAAYCRDNGPSWMIPRFETPNEMFNNGGGFYNRTYGEKKSNAHWGSTSYYEWVGKALSVMGQGVAATYSVAQADVKTQTRYHLICGVQTAVGDTSGNRANFDPMMSSAAYIAQAAAPQTGYSKTAGVAEGWRWTTHIATAQYMTPADYASSEESAAVTAYQTAPQNVKTEILNNYVDSLIRVNAGGSPYTATLTHTTFPGWKTWAQSWGVNKMCGYEGGWSPDYVGGDSAQTKSFRNDAKASERIALYLADVFSTFMALNDSTFVAEFPSTFYIADFTGDGSTTTYVWTLLNGELETTNTAGFDFIVRFNTGRRAISPRLRIHG